jgi:hypothetical protein
MFDKIGPLRPRVCSLSTRSSLGSRLMVAHPSSVPRVDRRLRRGDDIPGMACKTGRTPCPFVDISNYFLEIPQEALSSHRALHQYAAPIQRVPPSAHQIEL